MERRSHARVQVDRPCKVLRRQTGQYAAATAVDVSATGALIEIKSARPLAVGETLDVLIAWSRSVVLSASDMVRGRVIRVGQGNGTDRQVVAVCFAQVAELSAVA